MAKLDASIADRNVTTGIADRSDAYKIAVRLLRDSFTDPEGVSPDDALYLAQFLTGN